MMADSGSCTEVPGLKYCGRERFLKAECHQVDDMPEDREEFYNERAERMP